MYEHVRKRHPHLVKSIPQPETAGIASFLATLSHVALVCIIAAVSMVPLGLLFGKVLRPVWAALGVRIPCASTVEAHSATMLRCITARRARWMRKAKVVHISLDVWSKRGRSILGVLATVVGEDNTSRIFPIGYVDAPQSAALAFDGRTLEQRLMAEIDEFIRQPHLCGKSGAPLSAEEALSMWTAKAATFPLLSRIAVITRTTPASTAPLERAFSGLSYLLSAPTRSRMKTETANRKLLIRAWAMEQLAATSKDQLEEEEAEDADAEGARGRGGGEARAGAAVGCGADGRGGAGAAVGCGADAEDDGDDGIEYGDSDADE